MVGFFFFFWQRMHLCFWHGNGEAFWHAWTISYLAFCILLLHFASRCSALFGNLVAKKKKLNFFLFFFFRVCSAVHLASRPIQAKSFKQGVADNLPPNPRNDVRFPKLTPNSKCQVKCQMHVPTCCQPVPTATVKA